MERSITKEDFNTQCALLCNNCAAQVPLKKAIFTYYHSTNNGRYTGISCFAQPLRDLWPDMNNLSS